MKSKLLAYAQLVRLPNVFTAIADILMGFLIAHGPPDSGSIQSWVNLLLLVGSSCSIYWAGMVLNDYFDIETDRKERPERPLPSGRIEKGHALKIGVGLLLVGIVFAALVSTASLIVAVVLVVAVVSYDGLAKKTPFGPIVMGLCRVLNVFLGMSIVARSIWLFEFQVSHVWRFGTVVAVGLGFYIMQVTRIAMFETERQSRIDLISKVLLLNLALLLIAFASLLPNMDDDFRQRFRDNPPNPAAAPYWVKSLVETNFDWSQVNRMTAAMLWSSVLGAVNVFLWRTVLEPQPQRTQQAIKTCILALIGLDAAIVALVIGQVWCLIILLLLIPTLILGKWVYST